MSGLLRCVGAYGSKMNGMQPMRLFSALTTRLAPFVFFSLAPLAWSQTVSVDPVELGFEVEVGAPSPSPQTFLVTSSPPGQQFSARAQSGLINPDWLSIFPEIATTPATVTAIVDSSRFDKVGSRSANVIVTLTQSQVQTAVEVTINVQAPSSPATIDAAPSAIGFGATSGGLAPAPQTLIVRNSGGDIMDYTVSISFPAGQPSGWLQVDPFEGSVSSTGSVAHQVNLTSTNFPEGQYSANILIEGQGLISGEAVNSPLAVPVTLTIGTAATISATPSSLSFFASEDGAFPEIQTMVIQNAGGGELAYEIEPDQPWLFVQPLDGDATGGPVQHEVLPDTRGFTQGTFLANLVVASANAVNSPFLIPVRLTIGPPSQFFVLPTSVDFLAVSGTPLRQKRILSIVNNPLEPGSWSARVVEPQSKWLKLSSSEGEVPGQLVLEVDTTGLGAAALRATVEISSIRGSAGGAQLSEEEPRQGAACVGVSGACIAVPVGLAVINQPSRLGVAPRALRFEAIEDASEVIDQRIVVENRGGPVLKWDASVETENGEPWLSVTPRTEVAPTFVRATVTTTGLDAGVYQGKITVEAGAQREEIPVSLLISPREGIVDLSRSAVYFETIEGDESTLTPASVNVFNRGLDSVGWTALTGGFTSGGAWLSVSPSTGLATPGETNQLLLTPDAADLVPGLYGATVEVRSVSRHSARFLTAMLRVKPSAQAVSRTMRPSGLAFVSNAGSTPSTQSLTAARNRPDVVSFQAAASTTTPGDWLSVAPARDSTDARGQTTLEVSVDADGLVPGVHRGLVSITYGDGLVLSAHVTLIVSASPAGACTANGIAVAPISPPMGFAAAGSRATAIEALLLDTCGRPVEDGAVLARFNTGDSAMPLRHAGGGLYTATWAPRNAGSQANILLDGLSGAFGDSTEIIGGVEGGSNPAIEPYGVVDGASFASGQAIAPGAITSLFGRNLTNETETAGEIPLPEILAGVEVFAGGRAAPLYFGSRGQMNVQMPVELNPETTTQVFARSGGQYTVPEEVQLATANPGVFFNQAAVGPNRTVAQNEDLTLNSPGNPAAPGSAVTLYASGIGPTNPEVPSGEAAPDSEPLARATSTVEATIGGEPADVLFLGLAPGFVGLGQVNLRVPASAPIGAEIPVVIRVNGRVSNMTVISVGAPQ